MSDDRIIRAGSSALVFFAVLAAIAFLAAQFVLSAPLDASYTGFSLNSKVAASQDDTGDPQSGSEGEAEASDVASEDTTESADPFLAFTETPTDTPDPTSVATGPPTPPADVTWPPVDDEQEPNDPTDPGEDPPDDPSDPGEPPSGVWVFGTVVFEDVGLPVPGISVRIQGTETSATTNASGAYRLPVAVPESAVRVKADLGGTPWRTVGVSTVSVEVGTVGGTRHDFILESRRLILKTVKLNPASGRSPSSRRR